MLRTTRFALAALLMIPTATILSTSSDPVRAAGEFETWTGRVDRASDGDTMRVNVDGRGLTAIRLIGVNAFELGECSADIATDELNRIARGRRVTLRVAEDAGLDRYGRYHAYVTVGSDDIGASLLEAGMVWPVPKVLSEPERTLEYYRAAMAAADDGLGIWDQSACGGPPHADATFELRVLRNPDGLDEDDPNKEWVRVVNTSDQTVDLSNWSLRSSGEEKYEFPAGTSLRAGRSLKVHAGHGRNTPNHHYWKLGRPMFANFHAESVVLIDSLGNLREFKQTPCPENCSDPLQGKVQLRASYDAPGSDTHNPNGEWVEILNVSNERIDLVDYVLINDQHRFIPGGNADLDPGERMRVYIGAGTSTRTVKYWGKTRGILANGGDDVVLRNIDGVRIARLKWPCTQCAALLPDVNVVFVNPDAPGTDDNNLSAEYIVIRNDSPGAVDLTDWALRAGSNWFRFHQETLPVGHTLTLVSGSGTDTDQGTEHVRHWGRTKGTLGNARGRVELIGPNHGLADCYGWGGSTCDRPERRRNMSVTVVADPHGSDTRNANQETVRLKNRGTNAIDISGFRVTHRGYVYVVRDGTVLQPGAGLTVHAGHGNPTNHHQYWGTPGGILANGGGTIVVFDPDGYRARRKSY